ncbi:hypothetical protein DFH09DRAFT_937165 [Mycena vulgaris]|nr:hypothetical protein DFH09DRAFT_937165 [Mycena vulgaris]
MTPQRRARDIDPTIDPELYTPSKRMRLMTSSLATSASASFLVSKDPVTSKSRLPVPVLEGPPMAIPQPDWMPLALSDQDLERMSRDELIEAGKRMRQNLGLANQHIAARDGIIESSHATIVLQNIFVGKQNEALHAKENKKTTNRTKVTMNGFGRHLTSPEFIEQTRLAKVAREAEATAKIRKAKKRKAAKTAKEKLEEEWKQIKEDHELAVAAWEEECQNLIGEGCRKKDLPKKPVRPKKPTTAEVEEPPAPPEEEESDSDDD